MGYSWHIHSQQSGSSTGIAGTNKAKTQWQPLLPKRSLWGFSHFMQLSLESKVKMKPQMCVKSGRLGHHKPSDTAAKCKGLWYCHIACSWSGSQSSISNNCAVKTKEYAITKRQQKKPNERVCDIVTSHVVRVRFKGIGQTTIVCSKLKAASKSHCSQTVSVCTLHVATAGVKSQQSTTMVCSKWKNCPEPIWSHYCQTGMVFGIVTLLEASAGVKGHESTTMVCSN